MVTCLVTLFDESSSKMPKMVNFGDFWKKTEVYGQTVLPDRSPLMGQKLLKYAQIQKKFGNAKKSHFWRVFENLKSTVKQCYQTGHFSIDGKYQVIQFK